MPQLPLDYQNAKRQHSQVPSIVGKLARTWWPLLVLLFSVGLFWFWEAIRLHVDEVRPGSPAEVAEFTSVAPPSQATKIRVASFQESGGWGFAHYVRFEASPAICSRYAAAVVPGATLSASDNFHASLDPDVFKDMSWFDVGHAGTLLHARGNMPRPNMHVWVDTTRGVFYFMETD